MLAYERACLTHHFFVRREIPGIGFFFGPVEFTRQPAIEVQLLFERLLHDRRGRPTDPLGVLAQTLFQRFLESAKR